MSSVVQVRQIVHPKPGVPVIVDFPGGNMESVTSAPGASAASAWTVKQPDSARSIQDTAARVTVVGDKGVYIQFAEAPVASATNGWLCAPGTSIVPVTAYGHKFSIIEA